jgi:hypothetical protein
MIAKGRMISVPVQVLQDLIWNYELNTAGTGPTNKCEEVMTSQCEALQSFLTDAQCGQDDSQSRTIRDGKGKLAGLFSKKQQNFISLYIK